MTAFETSLATAFSAYADRAPAEIDAARLARIIALRERRTIDVFGLAFVRPRWFVPVLIGLLLLAALALAAYVGAALLRQSLIDDLQIAPRRPYAGALRPVGQGELSPDALLTLHDGTVFASRPSDIDEPNYFQLLNVDSGDITDIGRGLARRFYPGLAELPDGRILIVAANYAPPIDGGSVPSALVTSEIFDPKTGLSELSAPMAGNPFWPSVVTLQDGRVLILGGSIPPEGFVPLETAQIFDPATGSFSATGSMTEARFQMGAARLPDRRVLVVGTANGDLDATQTAEIYDPVTGRFEAIASPLFPGYASVTRLGGGQVLLAHGTCDEAYSIDGDGLSDSAYPVKAELYDWRTSEFAEVPDIPHCVSNLIGLPDGRAFISGFYHERPAPASEDILTTWSGVYDPQDGSIELMQGPRGYVPHAIGLPDGRVVIYPGGYGWGDGSGDGRAMDPAWADILE